MLPGDEAAIWEGVVLLEAGLVKCPADFQFKLLLVKLYLILGGYECLISFILRMCSRMSVFVQLSDKFYFRYVQLSAKYYF